MALNIGGKTSSIASKRVSPEPQISPSRVRFRSCESLPPTGSSIPSIRASSRRRAMVLISPLWPSSEKGWARKTVGRVLVEYRLWPMVTAERNSRRFSSG